MYRLILALLIAALATPAFAQPTIFSTSTVEGYVPKVDLDKTELERVIGFITEHGGPANPERSQVMICSPTLGCFPRDTLTFKCPSGEKYPGATDLIYRFPSVALVELQVLCKFGDPFKWVPFPPPPEAVKPAPKPEEPVAVGAEMPGYVPKRYWPGNVKAAPGTVMTHAQTGKRIVFRTGRANPFMPEVGYWEEVQ